MPVARRPRSEGDGEKDVGGNQRFVCTEVLNLCG